MPQTEPENPHSPTGDDHKQRYACPAGHTSWERLNNHVYCHACLQERHHDREVDPEWDELVDKTTGERVPVAELLEEWPDFAEVPAY